MAADNKVTIADETAEAAADLINNIRETPSAEAAALLEAIIDAHRRMAAAVLLTDERDVPLITAAVDRKRAAAAGLIEAVTVDLKEAVTVDPKAQIADDMPQTVDHMHQTADRMAATVDHKAATVAPTAGILIETSADPHRTSVTEEK